MTAIYTDRLGLDWDPDKPHEVEVAKALNLTLNNATSYVLALAYFDLSRDDVEGWDAMAEELLLDTLDKEQLALAVLRLITPHAAALADQTMRELREARTGGEFGQGDLPGAEPTT